MEAASPSAPSEIVGRVLRGNRKMYIDKRVTTDDNGLEDMDQFWNNVKTPKEAPVQKQPEKVLKQSNRKSLTVENKKRTPRFSLDGNAAGDGLDTSIERFRDKLEIGAISPGALSHVSTAPPTPKFLEETPEKTPEKVRGAIEEDDDHIIAQQSIMPKVTIGVDTMQVSPSAPDHDFPMESNHDDDDEDDLLPPPPPDDLHYGEEQEAYTTEQFEFPQDETLTKIRSPVKQTEASAHQDVSQNFDVDDQDDGGHGFEMQSPEPGSNGSTTSTETSLEPFQEKKRSGGTQKKQESDVSAKTPEPPRAQKKQKRVTMFSPPGYPIGNREMNAVPVSDFKDSPKAGVRRSRRMHVKPLAFWKNERVIYGPHDEKGDLGTEMGFMPVPTSVLNALPTPRKQRKTAPSQQGSKRGRPALQPNVIESDKPFDDSRLRKKYMFLDGEYAQVWDEALEEGIEEKVVSYAHNLIETVLPLPKTGRKKSESMVVGRAAQSFNVPPSGDHICVGYLMGNLKLPPKGIKDPESTGSCSQVFTVCSAQPNSVEVAFGDPNEEEGSLSPQTAQRFLLSAGDQFRIPPGNAYRLANHSKTTECMLAWTIIRPPKSGESI